MRASIAWIGIALVAITLSAIACRTGDPVMDPKTPPNSPVPKIERPSDPAGSPKAPKDGG